MSSNEALTIALVILVPAALLWTIFLVRSGPPGKSLRPKIGIPQALRPGEPDEVLEGPRLERIQTWGLVSTVALAIFIPAYWLPEGEKQVAYQEKFAEQSVERGAVIFQIAETLPEGQIDPVQFKEIEKSVALGMGCAMCHGPEAEGGIRDFKDPATGETVKYQVPPLNNVFQRWDDEIVRFTIERGRPGTDMPTWGVQYGGPMTAQMVDDVMAWLHSLPGNQPGADPLDPEATGAEIFAARCAVCHGPEGQGKEEPGVYYPGKALWHGSVEASLTKGLHRQTIINGRRFAFMPEWGETPPQGIPAPPNPLTKAQIKAVMEYERGL